MTSRDLNVQFDSTISSNRRCSVRSLRFVRKFGLLREFENPVSRRHDWLPRLFNASQFTLDGSKVGIRLNRFARQGPSNRTAVNKAKRAVEHKEQMDFSNTVNALDAERRQWLLESVMTTDPESPWLPTLSRSDSQEAT